MTFYPTATTLAGKYRQVYEGKAEHTRSGIRRSDLKMSKSGKIVSRKRSDAAKRKNASNSALDLWRQALKQACKDKGIGYTIPTKGTALYRDAKRIYVELLDGGSTRTRSGSKKRSACNRKKSAACKKSKKSCSWIEEKKGSHKAYCKRKSKRK